MNKPITQRQQVFLDAYQVTGQVRSAAARAGCSRELHYGALRTSETYREAFDLVEQRRAAELEEALWQRAVYGVKIPKFYRGELIGYEIRYSDTLLMQLLEARDPEKFGGIRQELQRQSREDGLGVRWDRDEVARPSLPRMTGPMPPAPPRPPRPPMPSISECGVPVTYAEWAAARGIIGRADCGPVDEEKLKRWAAGDGFSSVEWVPDEAAVDLVSEDADSKEEVADADGSGSDDSDVDFCVRWGAAEPDWVDDGSALPAPESVSGDETKPDEPGWGTGWLFAPEAVAPGADGLGCGHSDVGFGVRSGWHGHRESPATVAWLPVGKRLGRRAKRVPAPRPKIPRPFAGCRPRLNRGVSRAPPHGATTTFPQSAPGRRSPLSATHRPTPRRSSGTLGLVGEG